MTSVTLPDTSGGTKSSGLHSTDAKSLGSQITMIGAPTKLSGQECIDLVPTPVRIGPTEIELELYKCYDEGKPGFWRRTSFSLWIAGVTTLITTLLSFGFFVYKKPENVSLCNFFTPPMCFQIGLLLLYMVIGGGIEQVNCKHKKDYIDGVMKRYRGGK